VTWPLRVTGKVRVPIPSTAIVYKRSLLVCDMVRHHYSNLFQEQCKFPSLVTTKPDC
jgi:hypothetical protein